MTAHPRQKEHMMSSTPATVQQPGAPSVRETTPDLERRLSRLRIWNVGVGIVLALEASPSPCSPTASRCR